MRFKICFHVCVLAALSYWVVTRWEKWSRNIDIQSGRSAENKVVVNATQSDEEGWFLSTAHPSDTQYLGDIDDPSEKAINSVQTMWADYKQRHGHESLLRHPENRTFVVGYYSCPYQAGNRLHDFMNALIVAIVTNRTLLWKYYDKETCEIGHKGYGSSPCKITNKLGDCEQILQRAEWIPSYDEWAPTLGLPEQLGPRNADFRIGGRAGQMWRPSSSTVKRFKDNPEKLRQFSHSEERHPSKATRFQQKVVQTNREWFLDKQVTKNDLLKELRINATSPWGERVEQLYLHDVAYLYGLLFHDTFTLRPELHPKEAGFKIPPDTITVAMHVRHTDNSSNGTLSLNQKECLEAVVQGTRAARPHSPCTIFLMSDRSETVRALQSISKDLNCSTIVASHAEGTSRVEHGPFAGLGFFQDLLVAGEARDGVIGYCGRSSSQMLLEAVEYGRLTEKIGRETPPLNRSIQKCCLGSRISNQVNAATQKKQPASAPPNARTKQTGKPKGKGPKIDAPVIDTNKNKRTNGNNKKNTKRMNSKTKTSTRT
jgi:hypothetical protein